MGETKCNHHRLAEIVYCESLSKITLLCVCLGGREAQLTASAYVERFIPSIILCLVTSSFSLSLHAFNNFVGWSSLSITVSISSSRCDFLLFVTRSGVSLYHIQCRSRITSTLDNRTMSSIRDKITDKLVRRRQR
ncbi:uncharacterized protein LOC119996523 [Tripterygium wilfordii]|uniref:uncharacterized protein LOC119996523 n=1 Tax=Tripterygium wilfordii TaxID=458696 RepID=UPI0018F8321D|nr:uncharacterized protein LOC119996523 [Tripterygium wilfordii]